jgi:4-amino-4-deoxy-L-arabinose transferase-like glycosyltransferase
LIYFLAEEVFNKTVALFSGLAVAFYPDLIFWTSFARPETLFIFLLVLGFLLLIKGNSRKNPPLLYLSAIVLGFASLTRVTLTPFLLLILLWQARFFSKNRRGNLKVTLLMALIIIVVLLPWGIRNYIIFGEFDVLSDEAGSLIGSIESGVQYRDTEISKSYNFYDNLIFKMAIFIRDNFKIYLASCWSRCVMFWSPYTDVMKPGAKLYKGLSWLIIFPAAFWGIVISRKKWNRGVELIIAFIFYYSLLYTTTLMDPNLAYRYPIQPFLCIFAGYTFYKIYTRIKKG